MHAHEKLQHPDSDIRSAGYSAVAKQKCSTSSAASSAIRPTTSCRSTRDLHTSSHVSSSSLMSSAISGPKYLRSAYRIPPMWTRNPPMKEYIFTCFNIVQDNHGKITFISLEKEEKIHFASDWQTGEESYKAGIPHKDTGFIGKGYTKCGIYVSVY